MPPVVASSKLLYAALEHAASLNSLSTKFDVVLARALGLCGLHDAVPVLRFYSFDGVETEAARDGTETIKLFDSTLDLLNKNPAAVYERRGDL